MGIFQINRLAALSYVQFWNINKTFESRGEGERERKREQDMAWWSLMFYWTDTNYFGPGLQCLVEVSEKASQGMPWALCGDERGAACVIESLRLKATFILVIYFFSEETVPCERITGLRACYSCACEYLNRKSCFKHRGCEFDSISKTNLCWKCDTSPSLSLNSNHWLLMHQPSLGITRLIFISNQPRHQSRYIFLLYHNKFSIIRGYRIQMVCT